MGWEGWSWERKWAVSVRCSLFSILLPGLIWSIWSIFAPIPTIREFAITKELVIATSYWRGLDILFMPMLTFWCFVLIFGGDFLAEIAKKGSNLNSENYEANIVSDILIGVGVSIIASVVHSTGVSIVTSVVGSAMAGVIAGVCASIAIGVWASIATGVWVSILAGVGAGVGTSVVVSVGTSIMIGIMIGIKRILRPNLIGIKRIFRPNLWEQIGRWFTADEK